MKTAEQRAKENIKRKVKSTTLLFILLLITSFEILRAYLNMGEEKSFDNFNKLFSSYFAKPLSPVFIPNDIKYAILFFVILIAYIMKVLIICTDTTLTLPEHEQKGSNRWGNIKAMDKYREKELTKNVIFTQNFQMSMSDEKTNKNNNTLVIGASGSGKTFRYISPNLLNVGEENIVVNDVKGEILIMHGKQLIDKGYDVRVFNSKNMTKSLRFNPLSYIRRESDILSIAKMLSEALGDGGKNGEDAFWKSAKENLITACIAFIWERRELYPEQCNLPYINDLLRMSEEKTDTNGKVLKSDFDKIFEIYSSKYPERLSSRSYGNFKMNKDKTRANVLTTLSSMLSCLDIQEARDILSGEDEMHLEDLATKNKIAIFLCSSDTDSTWNFLTTLAVSLGLNKISDIRDEHPEKGTDVIFWLDEFANGSKIKDCEKVISVCRSRRIAMKIIVQSTNQLEKCYKDEWKIIIENCDTTLVLGANGESAKYISERLGKQTLNTKSTSQSKGKNGNFTTNNNVDGRELITADEIERLNDDAIVIIRGEYPIIDKKYDTKHDKRFKLMGYVKAGAADKRNYFFEPDEYRNNQAKREDEKKEVEEKYDAV